MNHWLRGLNPEQQDAVLHTKGPLLILAGAGSGKTTVLVSRAGNLIQNEKVKPAEICILTFTNKAARELKHRLVKKIGPHAAELWAGTFHSFGLRLLREHGTHVGINPGFGVMDSSDAVAAIKDLVKEIRVAGKDSFKMETVLELVNALRSRDKDVLDTADPDYRDLAEVVAPKYLKRLNSLGVLDFEGLLLKPLELVNSVESVRQLLARRYKYIMVDEFQDTNRVQFDLVKALLSEEKNLGVVGDDDQSIYGWRGACISNILDFPKRFKDCRVIRLEQNYRSTSPIVTLANHIIAENKDRHGKVLRPMKEHAPHKPEIFVYENDQEEAEEVVSHINHFEQLGLKRGDIAILYRSNGQSAMIEAELRKNRIEYSIAGGIGLFDRKEIKDILAYLRLSVAPNELAFRRVVNVPARGIGDASIDALDELAKKMKCKIFVASRKWRQGEVQDSAGVSLDQFWEVLDALPEKMVVGLKSGSTMGTVLLQTLKDIGYYDYMDRGTQNVEYRQRQRQILDIFATALDSFASRAKSVDVHTVKEFVDLMELRDLEDEEKESAERDRKVQLMTLHASKGLEFPAVVLVGVEEDLIPHRVLGTDISEERRLFYVGVTRAQEYLVLTRSRHRNRFGALRPVAVSRFVAQIPADLLRSYDTGFRPVSTEQRKDMLGDLMARLAIKAQEQKLE